MIIDPSKPDPSGKKIVIPAGLNILPKGAQSSDQPGWTPPQTSEECRRWFSDARVRSGKGWAITPQRVMIPYLVALFVRDSELANSRAVLFCSYGFNGQPAQVATMCGKFWRTWERRDKNVQGPWPDVDEGHLVEVIDDNDFMALRQACTADHRKRFYRPFPLNSKDPWCFMSTDPELVRSEMRRLITEGPSIPDMGPQDAASGFNPRFRTDERPMEELGE